MHRVELINGPRTAQSLLAIPKEQVPATVHHLIKAKQLSVVVRNLNHLVADPHQRELGQRAFRHIGFDDI